ncbi:MAG: hypothetical protein P1V97_30935 [Planctomycetota bacterium]|nr:hypothetical protein [Planctomycetota bacterium]
MRALLSLSIVLALLAFPSPVMSQSQPIGKVVKHGKLEFTVQRLGYQIAGWSRFEITTKNLDKSEDKVVIGKLTLFSKAKKQMGQAPVFITVKKSATTKTIITVKEKGPWAKYQFTVSKSYKAP